MKKYTLLNYDCLDESVLQGLPNDCDIVFTSPPYNIGNEKSYKGIIGSKTVSDIVKYKGEATKDSNDNWVDFIEKVVLTYLEKAQFFFLNLQKLRANNKMINELLYRLNKYYCDEIIIDKNNGIPNGVNKNVMTNVVEYIYIFSKKGNRAVGNKGWNGTVKNIFHTKGNQKNEFSDIHKAVMPQDWSDWVLENFVREGGKVIDCFMGMGTTGMSCIKYGMEFYGIELEKDFYDKSIERLEKYVKEVENRK